MRKNWIGMLLSFLLLSGSITPSVYAVSINDRTNTSQGSTSQTNETTATSSNVPLIESTNPTTEETTGTTENSAENSSKDISVDEVHFPDQNFRQVLIEMMEKNHSNVLSDELLATTELDLSGRNIKSLDGIEYFKQLKKLEVQNNELEQVDVSALSELTYLDVSKNKLSTIDLSMNDHLTYFNGKEQLINAEASKDDREWVINQDNLKPELNKIDINSTNWEYNGSVFTTVEPSALNYSYQVEFSQKAILEETSNRSLDITVDVKFLDQNSVESIIPKEEKIEMIQGETKQLEYSLVPENAEIITPNWVSVDNNIVEVDEKGLVTAKAIGETEVLLKDGERTLGKFNIQVEKNNNDSITQANRPEQTVSNRAEVSKPSVSYQTHVQTYGWQSTVADGATAGTIGQGKRIEAIKIQLPNNSLNGDIEYSSHVRTIGWQNYVKNGATSGTTDLSLRTEAIRIRLTGEISEQYSVYYRVHSAYFGWLGWAKDGEDAGSSGFGYQMEAIQIQLVKKGEVAPTQSTAFYDKDKLPNPNVNYQTHSQSVGWQPYQSNGSTAGTMNRGLRLEAVKINVSDTPIPGSIEYSSHVRSIGWQNYVRDDAISGTTDRKLRTEAIRIRLTGQLAEHYDVYYRVHSAYFGWLGWTKNNGNAGSAGFGYQMEAMEVRLVAKGQSGPAASTAFYDKDTIKNPNVNYQTHSQSIGWQGYQMNGATAGTVGRGFRLEALRMNISSTPIPGTIEYSTHVQSIGWQNYVNNNTLSGTEGRKLRAEAIRVRLTGQLSQHYDVYYRVHSAQLGWLDWARNGQNAGTSNVALQMEAIQVVLVKKGAPAPGPTSNPYQTSINHLFVMGHGAGDPGASYNGINERDFTRNELMPYLQKWAGRLKTNRITFYDTNADMFQDTRRMQGAYTISSSFSSVTEFHLDAGAIGISTGGHVIAHRNGNSYTTQNYAIANVIRTHVGLWGSVQNTGGINLRSDLLNLNVLHSRGIPYRLAELGFITNTRDVENIRRNMDQIAKGIVEGVTGERL